MLLDAGEIGVVQFRPQHGEQPPEPFGTDLAAMGIGQAPKPLKGFHDHFHQLDGVAQHQARMVGGVRQIFFSAAMASTVRR